MVQEKKDKIIERLRKREKVVGKKKEKKWDRKKGGKKEWKKKRRERRKERWIKKGNNRKNINRNIPNKRHTDTVTHKVLSLQSKTHF